MTQDRRVHFVGIGGAGMSAIARVFLAEGVRVSGSDLEETDVTRELRALGARVHIGHDPANLEGASEVILSTAIAPDNPEAVHARRLGIPVRHRSEALAEILNAKRGVAVAGAHGKTTTTSMIAWTLLGSGADPTFLIGGVLPGVGGARAGSGDLVVAEADESDRSFLRYRPHVAVVTSIEPDHLEYYENSFECLREGYRSFLENVKPGGARVLCVDDPSLAEMAAAFAASGRVVAYGFSGDAAYRAEEIRMEGYNTSFTLVRERVELGRFQLRVPGRHNVQNALACIAACEFLGVDLDAIRRALADFKGARRRFELVGERDGALIVDDYAHHPSEIKAILNACRSGWPGRRVLAVFQPHRYSRTSQLLEEFAGSFSQADLVVLTDIYAPPPEKPIPGVSGERLAALAKELAGEKVTYVPDLDKVVDFLKGAVRPGDIVVTMGAGNVWRVARTLVSE